jgi:C4-dicarboxylate-specific signal transduction histidine kinase
MELAHVNRVATIGQLTASITHEVNQPIAPARNNVSAALHFLDRKPPDLQEVREALGCVAKDTDRAGAVVGRMRALMQKAPKRTDRVANLLSSDNQMLPSFLTLASPESPRSK